MGLGIVIAVGGTPDTELSDAVSVEVFESMSEMTTFRIRYDLAIQEGDFPALVDARLDPGSEVAVIAPLNDKNNYLVKGPVTAQQIHFVHGGGGSYVEVSGADTSIAMDRETKSTVWTDLTDSDAVSTIFGQYGYTPDVDATQAGHFEAKHTLVQRESDLSFVRRLARRNGFLFWITCDENGIETAHFSDKSAIDGGVEQSPLTPLGAQPLSAIAAGTRSIHVLMPVDDSGDLTARGEAALIDSGWFIRATCQTSVNAMSAIIRANSLVSLRGVGTRHSGKYYVKSVRHTIDPSAHNMEIELIRNAWGNP